MDSLIGPTAPAADLTDAQVLSHYPWPDAVWVRANMVASVDGSAHGTDGLSGTVNSEADRALFSMLRRTCDAIVVGAGTARAEDYRMPQSRPEVAAARRDAGLAEAPALVIVTKSANLPLDSRLFADPIPEGYASGDLLIATTSQTPDAVRAELAARERVDEVMDLGVDSVDLNRLLNQLAENGMRRILVEGGPHLLAALMHDNLLDDLCLTISPTLTGSLPDDVNAGPILVGELGEGARSLRLASVLHADGSLMSRYEVVRSDKPGPGSGQ